MLIVKSKEMLIRSAFKDKSRTTLDDPACFYLCGERGITSGDPFEENMQKEKQGFDSVIEEKKGLPPLIPWR